MPLAPRCTAQTVCHERQHETILVQPVCFFPLLMPLLTEILSPDLPQHDLIAAHPDWQPVNAAELLPDCPELFSGSPYLQLSTAEHRTDGFFAAVWIRPE